MIQLAMVIKRAWKELKMYSVHVRFQECRHTRWLSGFGISLTRRVQFYISLESNGESQVKFFYRETFMKSCLLGIACIILVSGCASFTEKHSRTLLMDRATGEMKECTVDKWRIQKSYDNYRECIKAYEEQGYTVWSQY